MYLHLLLELYPDGELTTAKEAQTPKGIAIVAMPLAPSFSDWDGEPRVIYHDVLDRVQALKRAREVSPFTRDTRIGAAISEDTSFGSRRRSEERSVKFVFDLTTHDSPAPKRPPRITAIDSHGEERQVVYRGNRIEPLRVGSVLVFREAVSGQGLAAYMIGEEKHQGLVVGNGVACSPTLLLPELYGVELLREVGRPDVRVGDDGDIDDDDDGVDGFERGYTGDHDDDDEYYFYDQHADGSPGVHGSGSRSTHFGGGVDDEARARKDKALMLRERALGELMGREEAVADQIAGYGAGPQELFRQAADMGDPESYFYLALLQSAGLHGEQTGSGDGQARTWARCGAHAFSTDANLLLAYRFHKGHMDTPRCREGVFFYQQAVEELREGREDASQDLFPPPDAYRLGGEHGLGGWGVNIGGGVGGVGVGGGPGMAGAGAGAGAGEAGGVGRGGGAGAGFEGGGAARDVDVRDDVLLRAEAGDPTAMMMLGYLYILGSEEMAIKTDFVQAEQMMWKAVRSGEYRAYIYLAWMHHHGSIGGHLPPELQPTLPPGGDPSDPRAAANLEGGEWPMSEEGMRSLALKRWGPEQLEKTRGGKGVADADDGSVGGGVGGGTRWGRAGGMAGGGDVLRSGEDAWGGEESNDAWKWEVTGGGVSGAIAAADLYLEGFERMDPACGTALADMYLHSEYSDSRDGLSAGGKWAMMKAHDAFEKALEMGRTFGEPQTIAALRLGSMFQYGSVPYVGVNITAAVEYYQESAEHGGMDALLHLAELQNFGHKGVLEPSCEEASKLYKTYVELCIKDGALADGRIAFEGERYKEAFLHYLIAAEQGSKEGQASLAWLLDQGLRATSPSSSRPSHKGITTSSIVDSVGSGGSGGDSPLATGRAWATSLLARFRGGVSGESSSSSSISARHSSGDVRSTTSSSGSGQAQERKAGRPEGGAGDDGDSSTRSSVSERRTGDRRDEAEAGQRRRDGADGIGGVIDTVRELGGDPYTMARKYQDMAAAQGDADARCEIADRFYQQAKDHGAVPAGTGWLPWIQGKSLQKNDGEDHAREAPDADTPVGDRTSSSGSAGDSEVEDQGMGAREGVGEMKPVAAAAEKGDGQMQEEEAARLLANAVKYYRLASEAEGGGSRRGLFSMGWLHQHGVGVSPDPALARQYYLRSSSAPAVLGLWLMGLSDFVTEVAGPLALSMVIVGFTMVAFRLRKRMRRRRSRNGVGRGLRSLNVGHVGPDGREGEGRGDGRADSARR